MTEGILTERAERAEKHRKIVQELDDLSSENSYEAFLRTTQLLRELQKNSGWGSLKK
ncbi:hypothetical protein IPF37_02150 [bacterium]|nr:MAG: hypothetical protein IPF37_02150 [bacterium]